MKQLTFPGFKLNLIAEVFLQNADAVEARAASLDQLGVLFPLARNDRLAQLLTDDDVATLKHLFAQGKGANTLRALASDLAYLEAWAVAATDAPLPWPAPQSLLLKFIAHHLWDPAQRAIDESHGMPVHVMAALTEKGLLRKDGPHAPSTVRRRLANLATLHHWRGLTSITTSKDVKTALNLAGRAAGWRRGRKSEHAITRDILDKLVATCRRPRLIDIRDHALLLAAFGSGGRRRSEIAALRVEQLREEPAVRQNAKDPDSLLLPCLSIALHRTKTSRHDGSSGTQGRVMLVGRAVTALQRWLETAAIKEGPIFRPIDRHGRLGDQPLTPQSVNLIVKDRCRLAQLDPKLFSAHGLRSGYLTSASRRRVPMAEAMTQSQHRSVQQVADYYNEANAASRLAARLAE